MVKKEIIALLLAGGKGTRLESLTKKLAKPAVFFGGKYRIIDFPLSNCVNSGIQVVGVLTQYESVALNSYIGSGTKWGFDGVENMAVLLPPRQKEEGASWYQGTADAIYQNMDFVESYDADYVVILSGDHIYKMNYDKMLKFHKSVGADITIAVLDVDFKEASRFGIMSVDENNKIIDFEEKPKNPKSTLASMGIYIFSTKALDKYLKLDRKVVRDEYDFGKDIIPLMLRSDANVYAYNYSGYWKDVGTIESLWSANMDLLDSNEIDINNDHSDWKIYSEDTKSKPQYISHSAEVKNSLINQGCNICGKVNHSVVFNDVVIEEGAEVIDSVILPFTTIKKNAVINKCIVSENLTIKEDSKYNLEGGKILLVSE